jgi:hypothetical protein
MAREKAKTLKIPGKTFKRMEENFKGFSKTCKE